MNLKDFKKRSWRKLTLWGKIQSIWWDIWFDIADWWYILTNTCPHEATVGKVGSKKRICLLCRKELKDENHKKTH
jgi:hypothetical protein